MSALEEGPFPFERSADRHADAGAERERMLMELRRRIRSRLQPVICHLPEGEIDALVEQIARFKYRHEGKTALRTTPARGNPIGAQND